MQASSTSNTSHTEAAPPSPWTPSLPTHLPPPLPACPWSCSFGPIDGVQLGELLGRGSYGRVYKGRWRGAIVAVKGGPSF